MLLGVVSDTHGQADLTRQAVRLLESFNVAEVLHCGDIGSPLIVPLLRAWPAHFVFGNVDEDRQALRAAIESAGQTCHGEFGELKRCGRRIALLHGHDTARLREVIDDGRWDLVCHGHTHVARCQRHGSTLVLNPGALFRARPHSLAVVELATLEVQHVTL